MNSPEFHVLIEPHTGASYDDQLAVAHVVEAVGLAGLFRADHYYCHPEHRRGPWTTDAWTTLAGLARETTSITLGTLVSAATFRQPATLAVTAAQVDAMSGGRIELGLGAAWWEAEHEAYGIPFPGQGERFDRLAEQLAIITGLWTHETYHHTGRHYQLVSAPGISTTRAGGPPIIIGGSGRQRTPQLAARYAAEFNSGWQPPAVTAAEFARVEAACRADGREPASLRKSTVQTLCLGHTRAEAEAKAGRLGLDPDTGIVGDPDQAVARISEYIAAGAQRFYLELLDLTDHDQLHLFTGAVRPRLTQV